MRPSLNTICESFISSRDTIKKEYKWDNNYIVHVCAAYLASRGIEADAEKLVESRKLIEQNTGIFSNFRGNVKLPLTAMFSISDAPMEKLVQTTTNYDILKAQLGGSQYLTLVSAILADMTDTENMLKIAGRGKAIYKLMKKEHPFLTNAEDSVFAVLLAFSEKSDEQLIEEMEKVYGYFKKKFNNNALQSVSHVLALTDGSWEEKCHRMEFLWDSLKNADRKYSIYYELSSLAALAITEGDLSQMVDDILEVDKYLEQQKGYGGFGIDKKTRLLHAVMLVAADYSDSINASTAAVTATLAMIAAQQAAMCAIIASSSASSAAAASSN